MSPTTGAAQGPIPPVPGNVGIPRLIYLARILQLCFFPLATVLAGDVVLIFVPQAREALQGFPAGALSPQGAALWVAFVLWMTSAWYVARLLLGRRFNPDLVGICRSPTFAHHIALGLPRVLAGLAALPVPIALLWEPALRPFGAVMIITGIVLLVGLVYRRRWARVRRYKWIEAWSQVSGFEDFERFDKLSCGAWTFIGMLFAISLALLIALPSGMEAIARPIGSAALLLYALMSWTIFGGFVLTYLPKYLGFPAVTWVLLVAVFFAPVNENHYVARDSRVEGAMQQPTSDLATLFEKWLLTHPSDPKAPVIFIAASGGASRAAYWTTSALGKLEDESRGYAYPLSTNTFLISGVSGGSLGAAAYVTAVDLTRRTHIASSGCPSVRQLADEFTGRDDLATVIGLLLFPDLLQRFLPWRWTYWDRSRGLEQVWARDWAAVAKPCVVDGKPPSNPWTQRLTDLYPATPQSPALPILALNSTALRNGLPVLESNFTLSRADVVQVFSSKLATQTLTLAQAVHNSARFPYVSPAGFVYMKQPCDPPDNGCQPKFVYWDRLGDGGYMEASGAFMVAEVLRELAERCLIRQAPADEKCSSAANERFITWDQVRVLIVDNTPTHGPLYLCELGQEDVSAPRYMRLQNGIEEGYENRPPIADLTFPIVGAFETQAGRGEAAELDLLELMQSNESSTFASPGRVLCAKGFAELRMPYPSDGQPTPSMDWMLSSSSRGFIDKVLDNPRKAPSNYKGDAYAQLDRNLARVRSWFGKAGHPAPAGR